MFLNSHQDSNCSSACCTGKRRHLQSDIILRHQTQLQKAYLTAPLFHWEVFYKDDVDAILNGTWTSRAYWEGLSSGMVSLDTLTSLCAPGTQEAVDKVQSKIADGSFKIFAGPIADQSGAVKVAEGTTMSDDEIWNMGWFVNGVIGTIPQN